MGWRGLIGKPVRFPFGHGIAYTSFEYAWAAPPPSHAEGHDGPTTDDAATDGARPILTIHVTVRNVGVAAGREVAQLYLRYPAAAGEPPLVLRSYQKTRLLQPGEIEVLELRLTGEQLSIWDEAVGPPERRGGWRRVHGEYVAVVAASSRDHRLSHPFSG